ncbi:MAG: aspartate kinase [Nitrososphaerales archaeon]
MKLVMKFGGTSIGDADRVRNVARRVSESSRGNQIVLVISALNGVTDTLIRMSEQAKTGHSEKVESELEKLRERHIEVVGKAVRDSKIRSEVQEIVTSTVEELEGVFEGISVLGEMTPRSRDRVLSFGERLSTPIVWGAVTALGLKAKRFTGGEAGIVTDEEFGETNPLMNVSKMKIVKKLEPLLDEGVIPVVTGFIAATQTGDVTTLGRGGSDYTATILGAALSADEVWICTDVRGMMTADPKIASDARTIPQLSYSEALEMTVFGAKALHPRALEPAMEYKIPVRVKNTFDLAAPGTLITKDQSVAKGEVAKSVALIRDVAMVNIGGAGMVGKPGIAARVFDILGRGGINILMISQSVSEANISMVLRRDYLEKAVSALEISLLGKGFANQVSAEDDVGVVAVVGAGMKGSPGVAARVFRAVADRGINVRMIAQGSSELNISFVVKEKDCEEAVRAIHEEFRLERT